MSDKYENEGEEPTEGRISDQPEGEDFDEDVEVEIDEGYILDPVESIDDYTNYNNLNNLYADNENKLALLRSELDICYSSGDNEISVIMIGPNNEGRQCLIQRSSYYRCFQE